MTLDQQIEKLIGLRLDKTELASQLGFFSKPVRVEVEEGLFVIKLYKPLVNKKLIQVIMENHDPYVEQMRKIGISIPETKLVEKRSGKRSFMVIVQKAFDENALTRGMIENGDLQIILKVTKLLFDDALLFWKNKPGGNKIGFHPTTRNYALTKTGLEYFDTFPPMLMEQKELNKIILQMAPVKLNIKGIIPLKMINRVSDEYYQIDKMLAGIVGSTCRLRPELRNDILDFSRDYVKRNNILNESEKNEVLELINKPPKLSGLWITFRKLFGKTGKPNIKE